MPDLNVLSVNSLLKMYARGREEVQALKGASFTIAKGEFIALSGPSGSGKSTLLNIIGLSDVPNGGEVTLGEQKVDFKNEKMLRALRRSHLGYVFQHFNLLPTLSAKENVMLPLLLKGVKAHEASTKAINHLELTGLGQRINHLPAELSGGEMQRVAVCRATVHEPTLILADEPTGNLDSKAGEIVLELLKEATLSGTSILMATHSSRALTFASRTLLIFDGVLVNG